MKKKKDTDENESLETDNVILTAEDKQALVDKYIKKVKKTLGNDVVIGRASDLDLSYDFMVPPIPALSSLMGGTIKS